jgi:outer membrane protein
MITTFHFSKCNTLEVCNVTRTKGAVFILVLVGVLLSLVANTQPTITLAQAITKGLASKKDIQAGVLDAQISRLQTAALYRKYLPQISADYQYLYNPILQTSILPIGVFNPAFPIDATTNVQFGTKWSQSAGVVVNQTLLDLSVQSRIRESKLQERISSLSQEQMEYELAYTIAQVYVDIYLGESKIRSLAIDTVRTFISYTLLKSKWDEKALLKSDLNTSIINHNNAVQVMFDDVAVLVENKVHLLFLMGASGSEEWDFDIDTSFFDPYANTTSLSALDVNQLPDLQQLVLQSEITTLQSTSERRQQLPTIGFVGYLGANQFSDTFQPVAAHTWFGISYVGLKVKVPILFGESPRNKIQQLQLQSTQVNLQREDKTLEYTQHLMSVKIRMDNLQRQLKVQEENLVLSAESILIFQARVEEGQESASNLNLEEAGLQLLKSEYEWNKRNWWVYWLDHLKYAGQLGSLWK